MTGCSEELSNDGTNRGAMVSTSEGSVSAAKNAMVGPTSTNQCRLIVSKIFSSCARSIIVWLVSDGAERNAEKEIERE